MARVYVEVFGCSANAADGEMVSGLLAEAGHVLADAPWEADASVVLTCVVKAPTERRVVKRLKEVSGLGRPLVVAGCMPKAERGLVEEVVPKASLMGPDDVPRVVEVLERTLGGERVALTGRAPVDKTCLPRVRRNGVVHIAPISSGCLGSCSYCIVKNARGRLHSYPAEEIVEDTRLALEGGCREVWVTAEDTAAYDRDGVRLPGLLEMLCGLDGDFRVRVGMMTPDQAEPIVEDLIDAYGDGKVFKFLHAPVQSGCDEVLGRMRRRYTVEDFRGLVSGFRGSFPDLSLSTDIICGFPGETEEQFCESVGLIEEIRPDVLNISRFWPRPGTEAAGMGGQLHGRETKEKSRRLSRLWRRMSLEGSLRWLGWEGEVLIDEEGRGGSAVGRNFAYKPIVVGEGAPLGEFVRVRATRAEPGYLVGEALN